MSFYEIGSPRLSHYVEAVALDPQDPLGYLGRARILDGRKRYREAAAGYSAALARAPKVSKRRAIDLLARRGLARKRSGDLQGALQDYDRALALDPQSGRVFYLRGYARMRRGDLRGAIDDETHAIELEPSWTGPYRGRGEARARSGDAKGALADYDLSLRHGFSRWTLVGRARVRASEGDIEGALHDLDRAFGDLADLEGNLQDDPALVDPLVDRALLLRATGKRGRARGDCDLTFRYDPTVVRVRTTRAVWKSLDGDREGALANLVRAATRSPAAAEPVLWLAALGGGRDGLEALAAREGFDAALARLYLGRMDRAALLALARRTPDVRIRRRQLCRAQFHLGVLAERAGRAEAARAAYQAAVDTAMPLVTEHLVARERLSAGRGH